VSLIFANDLARTLELSEEEVFELARTRRLPFAVTSASPRRLVIAASDLPAWRRAAMEQMK
jgi:hypothetical protein